jgi:hypothetical protein
MKINAGQKGGTDRPLCLKKNCKRKLRKISVNACNITDYSKHPRTYGECILVGSFD